MHVRVSQKNFCLYCLCIFYAVANDKPQKQEVLFLDFVTLFLEFIIKFLIHCKLVSFFLAVGCPSLAYSKNTNFIERECQHFEEGVEV